MTSQRRAAVVAAALAAVLSLSLAPRGAGAQEGPKAPPSPEAVEEAAQRFQRGLELYKEGDFKAAQVEFKRAHEISPNYRVLYNLGQVSYQLRDYVAALRSFEAYLEQGGREVPAARRTQVTTEIARLRTRVGRLAIEVDVPGVEVSVDDAFVGRAPLAEPVLVSAGQHRVAALKPGAPAPVVKTVEVGGGDKVEVTFELKSAPTPAPEAVAKKAPDVRPPPPPPPPPPENRVPMYVTWGATGVLAGGAIVTGLLARGQEAELEDRRTTVPVSRGELEDVRGRMKALALTADALGVAALVVGGVATYLTVRPLLRPKGGAAAESRALAPWRVGVGPGGAVVQRSF
jgi:hypothetical protein